ncbi:hypothetical protein ACFVT5_40890 [Streptomyces sp. NPDC058001]|uniref:hypothetical protein n=1 Tax=Streptomyces sp. NPDC058001 TaxID=3346300 RepID=UPI0036E61608
MTAPEVIAVGIGLIAAGLLTATYHPTPDPETAVACDDCPGHPDCPCADGRTDPNHCTCVGS